MIVIATMTFQFANAQTKYGLKAGANFATFTGSDAKDLDMLTAFYAGGFVNLEISDLISIQPDVLFSAKGAKSTQAGIDFTSNVNYISVPVMLQLKFGSIYAEAGPQFGFLMSSEVSGGGVTLDAKDQTTSTDFGAAIGAGLKFENGLGIGARYTMGFSSTDDVGNSDIKNSVIGIGLSYTFGGN